VPFIGFGAKKSEGIGMIDKALSDFVEVTAAKVRTGVAVGCS